MRIGIWLPSPEGALLRAFRARASLSQRELAQKLGKVTQYVGNWEQGRWRPSPKAIHQVSQVLGLTLAEEQQLLTLRAQPHTWQRSSPHKTYQPVTTDPA